jgi:hypothetical protein
LCTIENLLSILTWERERKYQGGRKRTVLRGERRVPKGERVFQGEVDRGSGSFRGQQENGVTGERGRGVNIGGET